MSNTDSEFVAQYGPKETEQEKQTRERRLSEFRDKANSLVRKIKESGGGGPPSEEITNRFEDEIRALQQQLKNIL